MIFHMLYLKQFYKMKKKNENIPELNFCIFRMTSPGFNTKITGKLRIESKQNT